MNTNQKIAVAAIAVGALAIIVSALVALFIWHQSPFNRCVRAYSEYRYGASGESVDANIYLQYPGDVVGATRYCSFLMKGD